jgi:hypothetical protein
MYPLVSSRVRLSVLVLSSVCLTLLGCGAGAPSSSSLSGGQLRGSVHGGQQPITGAAIQLYAAGTAGYGSSATPLLTTSVTTDAAGSFSITGDYTCPSSTSQLYIVATGGNPGLAQGTSNAATALMAALGPCSLYGGQLTLNPNLFITINEVTTVASVYALAPFMSGDATHVGASSTNVAGLANSFAVVNNLVNTTTGLALAATPAGNGTVPQATINTLGNILASCVNSSGVGSPCSALFGTATPVGGATPTDTVQAIYDISRNPVNDVSALYALTSATPPFQPALGAAPNDWTLAMTYSGIGVGPSAMAIDASGNVWMIGTATGSAPYSVFEVSNNGTVLSGSNGYTGGGLNLPSGIAIDPTGNAWVTSTGDVVKLRSDGTFLSGTNGYTGGGLTTPGSIAIDAQGNAWVGDAGSKSVIKLDNNGNILSGASGFLPGNGSLPVGLGIDQSGNVWVGDGASALTEFNNSGTVISGSGYPVTSFGPMSVSFDAGGNAWTNTNDCCVTGDTGGLGLNNIAKLSSSGAQISPASGYQNCTSPGLVDGSITNCIWWNPNPFALDGAGNVWSVEAWQTKVNGRVPNQMFSFAVSEISNTGTMLSGPTGYGYTGLLGSNNFGISIQAVAVDGGGDVWLLWAGTLKEFVGLGTPVVTPFSLGVKNGTLGQKP